MALEVPIVSRIPYDKEIKESIFEQVPVVRYSPYSNSAIQYRKLAAKMKGYEYTPPKFAAIKRFLNKFKRR
jgi:MinD-like ATPase involved in chromosome partitioning or flagellar assembly